MDVPERLAQLLEEEYKRVVWEMIYPGANSVSRDFPDRSNKSPNTAQLLPALQSVAQKPLKSTTAFGVWGILAAWIFAVVAIVLLLALLFSPASVGKGLLPPVLILVSAILSLAIAALLFLLLLTYRRKQRLQRAIDSSTLARSPNLKIQPQPRCEAFTDNSPPTTLPEPTTSRDDTSASVQGRAR
jgi:hypothetical protein